MTRYLHVLAFLIFAVSLAGCPAPGVQQTGYPAEITGLGESENFPLQAGAYKRGKMFVYAPGMMNHSIAYNRVDLGLQTAATLYFYPKGLPIDQQIEMEKQQILDAHQNGSIIAEREEVFEKNGLSYPGRVVTFQYDENFVGKHQPVFSQFILVELPDRFFKVRSTAPISQSRLAEISVLGLMEIVNWAY